MQSVIEAIACEIPCHPDFAFIYCESDVRTARSLMRSLF
jgi:hypothetical protein